MSTAAAASAPPPSDDTSAKSSGEASNGRSNGPPAGASDEATDRTVAGTAVEKAGAVASGGYGWVIVAALAVTETVSYGVLTYVFPVFLGPMTAEMGWTRAQATGAYSLGVLVAGMAAVPVGWWVDRHGPRGVMTAGSALAAALVLGWSRVEGLAAFYLLWAGMGLAMAAVLYEPAFAAVARWFGRRDRARALATVTFVAGFASTVFVPMATWLLARYGWRGAVAVLAAMLAVLTVPPHALLLRPPPDAPPLPAREGEAGRAATLRDALREPGFWWLAGASSLSVVGPWALAVHLVPMLMERGLGPAAAAVAMATVGAAKLPGRLGYAALAGRLSGARATAALFAAQAVALGALAGGGAAALWIGVALFGAADGATTPARAALVAEAYGAERFGRVGGALALVSSFARAGAPLGAALARDAAGGYGGVFAALAVVSAAAAALVLRAGTGDGNHGPEEAA